MSGIKNGVPAFPIPEQHGQQWVNTPRGPEWEESFVNVTSGMSLRDWFAGMALSGYMANTTTYLPEAAQESYRIADEMLAAREANDARK